MYGLTYTILSTVITGTVMNTNQKDYTLLTLDKVPHMQGSISLLVTLYMNLKGVLICKIMSLPIGSTEQL